MNIVVSLLDFAGMCTIQSGRCVGHVHELNCMTSTMQLAAEAPLCTVPAASMSMSVLSVLNADVVCFGGCGRTTACCAECAVRCSSDIRCSAGALRQPS
jgi:hypothetical protein